MKSFRSQCVAVGDKHCWFVLSLPFMLLALLLTAMPTAVSASSSITVRSSVVNPLSNALWRGGDTHGELTAEQLLSELDSFKPIPENKRTSGNFGTRDDTISLYFSVLSASSKSETLLLESSFTPTDLFTVMISVDGGDWSSETLGDTLPKAHQKVSHPHLVFEIPTVANGVTEILIQVSNKTSMVLPLRLWQPSAFARHSLVLNLFQGVNYGVLLALMLYNLFLIPGVRDRSYLYYALYLGTMIGFQLSIEGYFSLLISPENAWLTERAPTLFISLCMYFGLEFARLMANAEEYAPRHSLIIRMIRPVFLVPFILSLAYDPGVSLQLLMGCAILATVLIVNTIVLSALAGYRHAWFLMLAFVTMVPGIILLILNDTGIYSTSFSSRHVLQFGTVLEAILLALLLADRFNQIRNANTLVVQKNLKLEQAARLTQSRVSQQLISAQDSERKRIASELHDGIGQGLALISNCVQRLISAKEAPTSELLGTVKTTIRSMREVTHDLHPQILDQLGLIYAIESTVSEFANSSGMSIVADVDDDVSSIADVKQLHIFRIVQECLHNIGKHSKATDARVSIVRTDDDIFMLTVRDNGTGVSGDLSSGIGIASIKERATVLGGHVVFTFSPGEGTVVTVSFPVRCSNGDTNTSG